MLDSDAPTGATPESDEPTTPAPRRRRRAATRPAGPPAEVVTPAPEPEPTVEVEAAEVVPEAVAAEADAAPRQPESAEDAPAEPAESDQPELAEDAPAEPAEDEQPEAVEDAPTESEQPEAAEDAPAEAAASAESEQPEVAAAVEPAEAVPPARRRRSRAKAAPAEPAETKTPLEQPASADEGAEAAAAASGETLTELAAAAEVAESGAPVDDDTETSQEEAQASGRRSSSRSGSRGTRRRGGRKRADADAEGADADETTDEVGASLAELTASREQGELGEAARPADVSAALEDLAAAIGGEGSGEDDEHDADSDQQDGEDAEHDDDSAPRRRRRRRGGRRRRRSAEGEDGESDSDDDSEDSDEGSSEESDSEDGDHDGDAEGDDHAEASSGSSRRRRRRRRRGEDTGAADEDGVDVVIKVREPRRSKSPNDEITGIEGSTRMEAKRQRRREGRAAGRRRAPILSEAEFLARREALDRQMLIRQAEDYTQIAVMEDGILVEHYVDRDSSASLIGNIYLGRVQNVLPSMEAAFIDIGRGRNAVIYAGEVDWDAYGVTGEDRRIEKVLKSGQSILVQVTKDPIGAKGARLTGHISIPGRYVVYCPGGQLSGISRKLPDGERARLKGILDAAVGDDASVIVRTAAEGASSDELERDVHRLQAQWEIIEKKVKAGSAPQQLYTEPDLTVRIVRDLFTEDFSTLVVEGNGQGEDAWDTVEGYVTHVAPHLSERLRRWDRESEGDLFDKFRVNEQVSKALERKVHLPSGGSLIIDRTEAMTVIDVNTGKFTGTSGNLETTVTSNNLEAAEEVVRQLRLRDIGGIIVIDFIDMVLPANRELLLRRLVECLGRDRTRHQVAEVTSLGLVQMTRKRIGTGLAEAFTVSCETCAGRGYHVHDAPVATQSPSDGGDRDHGRRSSRSRSGRSRGRSDNGSGNGKGNDQGASGSGDAHGGDADH